jgi:hypothetical protein
MAGGVSRLPVSWAGKRFAPVRANHRKGRRASDHRKARGLKSDGPPAAGALSFFFVSFFGEKFKPKLGIAAFRNIATGGFRAIETL